MKFGRSYVKGCKAAGSTPIPALADQQGLKQLLGPRTQHHMTASPKELQAVGREEIGAGRSGRCEQFGRALVFDGSQRVDHRTRQAVQQCSADALTAEIAADGQRMDHQLSAETLLGETAADNVAFLGAGNRMLYPAQRRVAAGKLG